MAKIRRLRWLMFRAWLRDNAEAIMDFSAFPVAIYFGVCAKQRGFLFAPKIVNQIVLGLFACWLLYSPYRLVRRKISRLSKGDL